MKAWNELVAAALVGTERRPFVLPRTDGALGAVLDRLNNADPATQLLCAAAVVSTYERAGRVERRAGTIPAPCGPEDLPATPDPVARRLDAISAGPMAKLLPEWLAGVALRRWRVAPRYLPVVLELGRRHTSLREAIAPVLGKRGVWLARQNPDWNWAMPADVGDGEHVWATGTREQRLVLFQQTRRTDAAKARRLIESTWDQDPPEERAMFVERMGVGLSLDDEPLLESALEDRRKEVRTAAATLLASLPASRLARRMEERLAALVSIGRRTNHSLLDVCLPGECDKAMARDGVERKPPAGTGERAWWLQQVVGASPLAWWEALGATPDELIAAATANDSRDALLWGWATAAERQKNPAWAAALLRHWMTYPTERGEGDAFLSLLEFLAPDELERLVMPQVRKAGKDLGALLQSLLSGTRGVWTAALSRAILDALRGRVRRNDARDYPWTWKRALVEFVLRLPPSVLPEALEGWPTESVGWEKWAEVVEEFMSVARFRREMWVEFRTIERDDRRGAEGSWPRMDDQS